MAQHHRGRHDLEAVIPQVTEAFGQWAAKVIDGAEFEGIEGLRDYLLTKRGDAFVKQFCRKLLGYALGRAVQLSDGPLLTEMSKQLKANDYRVSAAVETIVRSKQFRDIRREGNGQ